MTVDSLPRERQSASSLGPAVVESYLGHVPMSGYFETRHNIYPTPEERTEFLKDMMWAVCTYSRCGETVATKSFILFHIQQMSYISCSM
jgi:hypothetical protein